MNNERSLVMLNNLIIGRGVTHTLNETAQLLGISRERVRQIENQALKKIRKKLILYFTEDEIKDLKEFRAY